MNDIEIDTFIEHMEAIGDNWERTDVKRVYGNMSLEDALNSRMGDMNTFANIIGTILNCDTDN